MENKINKKDIKLTEKYGSLENKGFEHAVKKMLEEKPAQPAKNKVKKKP